MIGITASYFYSLTEPAIHSAFLSHPSSCSYSLLIYPDKNIILHQQHKTKPVSESLITLEQLQDWTLDFLYRYLPTMYIPRSAPWHITISFPNYYCWNSMLLYVTDLFESYLIHLLLPSAHHSNSFYLLPTIHLNDIFLTF